MKLYKIRIRSNSTSVFDFMKFSYKNRIDILVSYQKEDMFEDLIFLYIGVPTESVPVFLSKYSKQIAEEGN